MSVLKTINLCKVSSLNRSLSPGVLYLLKEDGVLNAAIKHPILDKPAVFHRRVFLNGPKTLFQSVEEQTVTGEYIISNYSDLNQYTVELAGLEGGSVTRLGNTITVTSPPGIGDLFLIVNQEVSRIPILLNNYEPPEILFP